MTEIYVVGEPNPHAYVERTLREAREAIEAVLSQSWERSLAVTKLEEAGFWVEAAFRA